MQITAQTIGLLDEADGDTGTDTYILLTREDEALTAEQALEWIYPKVYKRSSGAGSQYCTRVDIQPLEYSDNSVIAVVRHRYDV